MPRLSAPIKRSLRAQCILLPPPLVTRANNREASVFSILLLIMLPQSISRSRSVHLPAEADVHLATELDVHFAAEAHVSSKVLKVPPPHADSLWLTIACCDSTDATLASHTHRTWTNSATSRALSCQSGQHISEGTGTTTPFRDIVNLLVYASGRAAVGPPHARHHCSTQPRHDALRGEER